ncbi:unnamed protein product [Rotaria sp. Silwood1]|nr:unnamed protein product [Rotaria sp. Silwood1]
MWFEQDGTIIKSVKKFDDDFYTDYYANNGIDRTSTNTDNNGKLKSKTVYKFNDKNLMVEQKSYGADDIFYQTSTYIYDNANRLIEDANYDAGNNLVETTYRTYDDTGNLAEIKTIKGNGDIGYWRKMKNNTRGFTTHYYDLNPNGDIGKAISAKLRTIEYYNEEQKPATAIDEFIKIPLILQQAQTVATDNSAMIANDVKDFKSSIKLSTENAKWLLSRIIFASDTIDAIALLKRLQLYNDAEIIFSQHNYSSNTGEFLKKYVIAFPEHKGDIDGIESEIIDSIEYCTVFPLPDQPEIYMVEVSGSNFHLQSHPVNNDFEIKDLDVNYGYGFEDAEPLLVARGGSEARIQGITNLLNMTDGLLNDMMKLQIICTFNVGLKKLDQALLRPGRLIARKEFKALGELDANLLAQRLGIKHHFKAPATLSEIYSMLQNKNTIVHDE